MLLRRDLQSFLLRLNPNNPITTTAALFGPSRCFSNKAGEEEQCPPRPFMVDYLVNSCGFSSEMAVKTSLSVSHLESTANPESVMSFFRSRGFNDAQVKKLLSWFPKLLGRNVEESLEPKFKALQVMGFQSQEIVRLVVVNPNVLLNRISTVQKIIELWRGLPGSATLPMSFFVRHQRLFTCSFEKAILPNMQFLRSHDVQDRTIAKIVKMKPAFFMQNPDSMEEVAKQVEEMGVPPSSGMFVWVLLSLSLYSKSKLETVIELMKILGWSQPEIISAVCKCPMIIGISCKLIRLKVDYLIKEVGMDPSYLIRSPVFLTLSLDKRIVPRNIVLKSLKSRGLCASNIKLSTIFYRSEEKFVEKFILPYSKEAPELYELYKLKMEGK